MQAEFGKGTEGIESRKHTASYLNTHTRYGYCTYVLTYVETYIVSMCVICTYVLCIYDGIKFSMSINHGV